MESLFISQKNFEDLLKNLSQKYPLYAPKKKGNFLFYEKIENSLDNILLNTIRPIQSLKSFLIPPYQRVSSYFSPDPAPASQEKIILGPKSCDLESLKILDNVYIEGDFKDPFYIEARGKIILISGDCYQPEKSCFCTLLELNPYPEEGFDLNLSQIEEGFVIEAGSKKGKTIVDQNKDFFKEAEEGQLAERDKKRNDSLVQLKEINKEFAFEKSFPEIIKDSFDSPVWDQASQSCVDCAGCNHICPTCRCFLLYDEKSEKGFEKIRLWDGCLYTGFAQVAAGVNPRTKLSQRFANRLLCKFHFFPENIGLNACTGCGRCINVCPGKIDMREVLRDLESSKVKQ